ncbi:MAG: type II and III secretion system protein [Fibromonadaceae bacterium]|jgi:hypothetical protein|nr:type II and III secretion system protein [Fibromonadaceae bacterium]
MRLDESAIDLHGWLRAFYSCPGLGRSFVMDHAVQRPLPSYANFGYGKASYAALLREVLGPLGLRLVQGKWVDAVVAAPPSPALSPALPPPPLAGGGGGAGDAGSSSPGEALSLGFLDSLGGPAASPPPRRLRARASGLLKSSARRMGAQWGEFFAETDRPLLSSRGASNKYAELWRVSLRASDSLGSGDFARVMEFTMLDSSARVVFGSETRRAESTINYETGSALTQYASIFDGLSVSVAGDGWAFVWRGSGSMLEVPGAVGSCASGSSRVAYEARAGVPFLMQVPVLGRLFSWEARQADELLVSVCVEEARP